jgi:hypothetical protein
VAEWLNAAVLKNVGWYYPLNFSITYDTGVGHHLAVFGTYF